MALYKRGGIYHYHFWVDGTRYRGFYQESKPGSRPASGIAAARPSRRERRCGSQKAQPVVT